MIQGEYTLISSFIKRITDFQVTIDKVVGIKS